MPTFTGSPSYVAKAQALFLSHVRWLRDLAILIRLSWLTGQLPHAAALCLIEAIRDTLVELRGMMDAGEYVRKGREEGFLPELLKGRVVMPVGVITEVYRVLETL